MQVGFKVSSRKLNSVWRNRIRRLMRDGMDVERRAIDEVLMSKNSHVGIIFFYKGAKELGVGRLRLVAIQKDIRLICQTIASAL